MPDNLFPRVGYFRPPPFSEVAEHGTQLWFNLTEFVYPITLRVNILSPFFWVCGV